MSALHPFHNIIFDFGGVIIDIDISRTQKALIRLGLPAEMVSYSGNLAHGLFLRYETGIISTEDLRNELRRTSGASFSDKEFDRAWCAMLIGIPSGRIKLLEELNRNYRVFLLSNTSPLHAAQFEKFFLKSAGVPMNTCFEKRYYSHETGLYKPDPEAFLSLTRDSGILPQETLFIDDSKPNTVAAEALGFQTIYLKPGVTVTELEPLKKQAQE